MLDLKNENTLSAYNLSNDTIIVLENTSETANKEHDHSEDFLCKTDVSENQLAQSKHVVLLTGKGCPSAHLQANFTPRDKPEISAEARHHLALAKPGLEHQDRPWENNHWRTLWLHSQWIVRARLHRPAQEALRKWADSHSWKCSKSQLPTQPISLCRI